MKCYAHECRNAAKWLVNGRYREAQSASCGVHLARCVADLNAFNDSRYSRRAADNGVMLFPVDPVEHDPDWIPPYARGENYNGPE